MGKEIRIERAQLYEEVWSEPITKLAEKYFISDVGLLKICKKLNIPVPGRGYWSKKRPKQKSPLPALSGQASHFNHSIQQKEIVTQLDNDDEIRTHVKYEKSPENRIRVSNRLSSPHPLVAQTQEALRPPEDDHNSIPTGGKKKCLDIRVSHKNLSRALRIYDALLKALEQRGYVLSINGERNTTALIEGEQLKIILEEIFKQKERRLTPEERIKVLTGGWVSDRHIMAPTGEFRLRIDTWAEGMQKQWCDGKTQRLENCLNDFIVGMVKLAAKAKEGKA